MCSDDPRLEAALAERDQWKANHDSQVAKKRRLHEMYSESLAREQRLREALQAAADDLGKAANQFASLRLANKVPEGYTEARVVEKEAKARAALSSAPDRESPESA